MLAPLLAIKIKENGIFFRWSLVFIEASFYIFSYLMRWFNLNATSDSFDFSLTLVALGEHAFFAFIILASKESIIGHIFALCLYYNWLIWVQFDGLVQAI